MRVIAWTLALLLLALAALLALLRWQPSSVPAEIVDYLPDELVEAVSSQPPQATAQSPRADQGDETSGPTIYAWKDDQGGWNYTDQPPADRPYETRQYRQDVNVVPAFQPELGDQE